MMILCQMFRLAFFGPLLRCEFPALFYHKVQIAVPFTAADTADVKVGAQVYYIKCAPGLAMLIHATILFALLIVILVGFSALLSGINAYALLVGFM